MIGGTVAGPIRRMAPVYVHALTRKLSGGDRGLAQVRYPSNRSQLCELPTSGFAHPGCDLLPAAGRPVPGMSIRPTWPSVVRLNR